MTKETQRDFNLVDEGSIETRENEARPLYAPLNLSAAVPAGTKVEFRAAVWPEPKALPTDPKARKGIPLYSGLLNYFPLACAAVAQCSFAGNEQHHPGTPLHWDKSKSTDHADCLLRHLTDHRLGVPVDPTAGYAIPHLAKVAWRALALLETALEKDEVKFA